MAYRPRLKPIMTADNKSEEALGTFMVAVGQSAYPTNYGFQMRRLLDAIAEDELVSNGRTHTGWDEDHRLTGNEFCNDYEMGGNRFKYALEALMDLKTPARTGNPTLTLREYGGDDWTLKIGMLVGGFVMAGMPAMGQLCQLWVACVLVLARQPDRPVPVCMRPKD